MSNTQLMSGDHQISLSDAIALTTTFRTERPNILASHVDEGVLPICETFKRGDLDTLLAQTGCEKLRIYLGMDEKTSNIRLVLVGVNEDDEDMVDEMKESNIILEMGVRCPDDCPPKSPLN